MNQNFKFFKIYVCFKQSNFLVEDEIEYSPRYFFFIIIYSPFVKMTFSFFEKVEKMTCFD